MFQSLGTTHLVKLLVLGCNRFMICFLLGNQEVQDLEVDDAELLASLEAQEEVERHSIRPGQDSGYWTRSEISMQSSGSSSVRHVVSTASFR